MGLLSWLFGPPKSGPTAPKTGRPTIGEWNHLEASIGQRGMGKSTFQCRRALDLQADARGAYVIGHSLGARLPRQLPKELGGNVLPITYYDSIAKLERGLRRHPERWHILAPPLPGEGRKSLLKADTADDLLRFVIRFSTAIRKAAWQKANPMRFWKSTVNYEGVECAPIIVIIDEGIAVEAAGTSRKEDNRWFLQFLYSLRHLHCALLYAIQDATARSWRVLEQATAIHVFAVRHAWALQAIQASGATPEEIERIRGLTKFHHVTLEWRAPSTVVPPESMSKE